MNKIWKIIDILYLIHKSFFINCSKVIEFSEGPFEILNAKIYTR